MSGRSVNIYLQEETYNQLRQAVGGRKISRFINEAVLEKLVWEQKQADEKLRQQLIEGYKANARNKKLQAELGIIKKDSSQIPRIPRQGEIQKFSKPFRPALVTSNNLQNEFDKLVTVATLTTEDVENIRPFEVFIKNTKENGLDYPSKILTGYSFSIYKERLIKKLGVVDEEIIKKTAILAMLANELPGENKYATFPCQLPWAEKDSSKSAQEYLDFLYPPEIRKETKEININGKRLKGTLVIKDFPNLEKLDCSENQLTKLTVFNCLQLVELVCYGNQLTELKIGDLPNLEKLKSECNQLANLNFLTSLVKPEKLTELSIGSNKSSFQDLTFLERFISLQHLDISSRYEYSDLDADENRFSGFDNLEELCIDNYSESESLTILKGKITNLDLRGAPKLKFLECSFNSVESLNISNNKELVCLDCSGNSLVDLDISNCENLEEVNCSNNLLVDSSFLAKMKHPERLEILDVSDNNFVPATLEVLRPFVSLQKLHLGTNNEIRINHGIYNRFYGSLEPLRNMSAMDKGKFDVRATDRKNAKCLKLISLAPEPDYRPKARFVREKQRRTLQKKIKEMEEEILEKKEKGSKIIDLSWLSEKMKSESVRQISRESFEQIIKKGIKGNIQKIDFFSTWFNPNCAVVISKKLLGYEIILVVYEPSSGKIEENIFIKSFPKKPGKWYSLNKVQEKSRLIKENLNGDSPILTISKKSNGKVVHISSSSESSLSISEEIEEKKSIFGQVIATKRSFEEALLKKSRVFVSYGKNLYDVISNNCEHFATLCVCGVSLSRQADKFTPPGFIIDRIDFKKEMKENEENFMAINPYLEKFLRETRGNLLNELKKKVAGEAWGQLDKILEIQKELTKLQIRESKEEFIKDAEKQLKNIQKELIQRINQEEMNKLC
ncbi:16797_t:CDS:10 [Cetraspora pellucida]|uniref:16797_t:CDS:1 n=1 Tax=Cetraspora pellucida TaxID=1433469 RepID=A0ACA9KZ03_9GLOM|nr:16797_t:CDS:10 [Cetraspora pellucida]